MKEHSCNSGYSDAILESFDNGNRDTQMDLEISESKSAKLEVILEMWKGVKKRGVKYDSSF